jgi:hypothetical protein
MEDSRTLFWSSKIARTRALKKVRQPRSRTSNLRMSSFNALRSVPQPTLSLIKGRTGSEGRVA